MAFKPRTVTGSIAASNTAGSSISVTEGQPVRAQATGWTSGGVLVQTSLDGGTTWATEAVLAVGTSEVYEGSAGVAQLVRCKSDSSFSGTATYRLQTGGMAVG